MSDTRKELVTILESALETVETGGVRYRGIKYLIVKAKEGYFHDFKSPLSMPKTELIKHLESIGLNKIAWLVEDGQFDEEPDEEDKKELEEMMKDMGIKI